jgi:hypothetical protein
MVSCMEYVPFLFFWNFLTCGIDMGLGMGSCGVCLVSLLYLSKRIVYSRFKCVFSCRILE